MTSTLLRSLGTAGEGEGVSPGGVYTPSMAPLLAGLLPGGEPPSLGEVTPPWLFAPWLQSLEKAKRPPRNCKALFRDPLNTRDL